MKARAVLFRGAGLPLELHEAVVPSPRGAEILVRISCCTLCTSDLHTHAGRRSEPVPTVLGHEITGHLEAFGPKAKHTDLRGESLQIGDRLSWSVAASCGNCFFCHAEISQKCERLYKYGHRKVTLENPFAGGLADVILLAEGSSYRKVPDTISDTLAAQANCATATIAAVLRYAGDVRGRSVLIFGAGILGLTATAMAHTAGASIIIVSDPVAERRERALSFGASAILPADAEALRDGVMQRTGGRGADVVLELAGVAATVEASLALSRIGGTIVLAGTVLPTSAITLDPERTVRRMLTIRGVHNYAPTDLNTAIDFLAGPGTRYPFAQLVGESFPLERIESAFERAHAHPGFRIAVRPN